MPYNIDNDIKDVKKCMTCGCDDLGNDHHYISDTEKCTSCIDKGQGPCWEGYEYAGTKEKNGKTVPNCIPVKKSDGGYQPNAGMKAAARRALKWKEDGLANGAGTPVGWGRATDIVAGRSMSLDTVKRMYSFFSRHEVDKKGKDWDKPSNGKIMWNAWGGDSGFSWSRAIVNRTKESSNIFMDFGKFVGIAETVTTIFNIEKNEHTIKEGDFVMGKTSEGVIHGMVEHIMTEGGVYGVPGTEYAIESKPENPAMAVRIYEEDGEGWKPTAYSIGMLYSDAEVIDIEDHTMDSEIDKATKPNYGNIIKPRKGEPADKELYARVIAAAKKKFDVYPSAVANAWVVQEYKRRGGKYKVAKNSSWNGAFFPKIK